MVRHAEVAGFQVHKRTERRASISKAPMRLISGSQLVVIREEWSTRNSDATCESLRD